MGGSDAGEEVAQDLQARVAALFGVELHGVEVADADRAGETHPVLAVGGDK
jgi:hypothetical protein